MVAVMWDKGCTVVGCGGFGKRVGIGEGGTVHWEHLCGQRCVVGRVMWYTCGP